LVCYLRLLDSLSRYFCSSANSKEPNSLSCILVLNGVSLKAHNFSATTKLLQRPAVLVDATHSAREAGRLPESCAAREQNAHYRQKFQGPFHRNTNGENLGLSVAEIRWIYPVV
jgi:hypothetical protein